MFVTTLRPLLAIAGDPVDAAQHLLGRPGHERADRIGAHVGQDLGAQPHQRPVPFRAELHALHLRPAVGERDHRLRPGLLPSDGAAEPGRDGGHRVVLRVDLQLGPEGPTHVGRDRADTVALDPQRLREVVADVERDLRGDPHRVRAVVSRHHRDPVRLDRGGRDPLVHESPAHHDVGALERVLGRRIPEDVRDVRPELGPEQRRALRHRRLEVHHHRERLVLHGDQLRRIHRLRHRLRDHDGDDLAHEPDDGPRERLATEQPLELAVGVALDRAGRRKRREVQIRCDVGTEHAGSGQRPRHVDPVDPRVRHDGADERGVQGPGDLDVVEVPALASEEPGVFRPESRHAEHGGRRRRHGADTDSGRSARHAADGDPGGGGVDGDGGARGTHVRARRRGRRPSDPGRIRTGEPRRIHVHAGRTARLRRAEHRMAPVPQPADRRRRPGPPDPQRQLRRGARGPRGRAPPGVAVPAVRLRLRDEEHRRRPPQPGPADQGRERRRRRRFGGSCRSPPARPATTTAVGSRSGPTASSTS